MRVERAEVALRPRSGLEAVDLGFAMVRNWWRPLARSWLLLVAPPVAALVWALREHPFWALVLIWWLRPAFARVPLFVLSRVLFGESATVSELARQLPRLLARGALASFFLQRLSPARSMLLPVIQLEGLRGAAQRSRGALLAQRDLGTCLGMVTVIAHMNLAWMTALLLVATLALPEGLLPRDFSTWEWNAATDDVRWMLLPALYFAGVSFAEPLLTASGFALYLNRRVLLEGWDLELAFRRLGQRRALAAALLALALIPAAPQGAHAQTETSCRSGDPASAGDCAAAILASDDFLRKENVTTWVLREGLFESDDEADSNWNLSWLAEWIAASGEVLLWLGVATAVIAVGVALLGARPRASDPAPPEPPPRRLFGLDLDPSGIPDDVVAAARALWTRGERAAALSLLYRGALLVLTGGSGLRVPAGATELECVGLVRERRPHAVGCFESLTLAWLSARYAHAPPDDAAFRDICAGYDRTFGARP